MKEEESKEDRKHGLYLFSSFKKERAECLEMINKSIVEMERLIC